MIRSISLADIAAIARRDGLAAGLTAAFDLREPVPCSPAGRTLVPVGLVPVVGGWSLAGVVVPAARCRVETEPHELARSEHLVLVRVTAHHSGRRTDTVPAWTAAAESAWPAKLLAVRAGLGRRLLGLAIGQLSGRTSDGAPLTERQLVRAEIAEIAVTLEIVESALPALAAGAETELWHDDLDRAEQSLTRLFGASGYLDDHPGRALRLVGLIRDVYAPPGSRAVA